jgi:hypothetical protein
MQHRVKHGILQIIFVQVAYIQVDLTHYPVKDNHEHTKHSGSAIIDHKFKNKSDWDENLVPVNNSTI